MGGRSRAPRHPRRVREGESLCIAGFGTLSVKSRPARQGRNTQTGEAIAIAASTVPSFKTGKRLRDTVG